MADFSAGDVVQLKSGGPLMTVEEVDHTTFNEPMAICIWFHKDQMERNSFSLRVLQKVEKGGPKIQTAGPLA